MNQRPETLAPVDISPDQFRIGLRQLAGAVSVITTGTGASRAGLTATSVTSVSAEPPTILVAVNKTASAYPVLISQRHFAVNVLSDRLQPIADRFAGRGGLKGAARFEGETWITLATGAPVLASALTALDCELEEAIERHSHGLLIGRVKAIHVDPEASALLYWRGQYERLPGAPLPTIR